MSVRSRLLLIALLLFLAGPAAAATPRCSPPPGHGTPPPELPPPGPPPSPPPPNDRPSPYENRLWRPDSASISPILSQQVVDADGATSATEWMAGYGANHESIGPEGGPGTPPDPEPTDPEPPIGDGEGCRLLQLPHATAANGDIDTSPFYTESVVATLAPGRSLELRMTVDATRFADAAGAADIDFVELDLERGDFAALLPVRLALHRGADGALRLSFRNADGVRVYSAHALRIGDVDVGVRWTALLRGQLAVTLLLDGQPVAQQILRGQVVALRIGLLDARGAIDADRLVELDRVHIVGAP